jgi:hypothetical protein
MTDDVRLPTTPRGERPRYFQDPAVDKVLSITMALAGEVAVMHDRLDSLERLLEARQPITRSALESFQPSGEERVARDAWRDRFLDVVMRSVHQELESLKSGRDRSSYAKVIELVENE